MHPESAANEVPANDEGGGRVSTSQGTTAKLTVVTHAAGMWESAPSGSDAWRVTPPIRLLIRKADAASLRRLRTPRGPPAKGTAVMLSCMIPSAPLAQADCVEMTKEVREVSRSFT